MNIENWNWAVWVYVALWCSGGIFNLYSARDKQQVLSITAGGLVAFVLLYIGGFFE